MRVLLIALALSACGAKPVVVTKPPADKLVCPEEPVAPAARGPNGRVLDEDAGAYMRSLRASWQGCKADVDWMRDWFGRLTR